MDNSTKAADVGTLNDLISLCYDSAKGYREAAEKGKNTSLSALFVARAHERDTIARELSAKIRELGDTPNEHGTLAGAAHRVILDVMAMVGDNTKVAINEVERGEDVIKGAFEKAMKKTDICQPVKSLITQSYGSIKAGHDQASALKHATG